MARGKVLSSRRIHCCPGIFYSLCPTSVSVLWIFCIYTYMTAYILYMNYRCYQIKTESETFLHKSGAVRSVERDIVIGMSDWRCLGVHVTLHNVIGMPDWRCLGVHVTLHNVIGMPDWRCLGVHVTLHNVLQCSFQTESGSSSSYCHIFFFLHSSRRPLLEI